MAAALPGMTLQPLYTIPYTLTIIFVVISGAILITRMSRVTFLTDSLVPRSMDVTAADLWITSPATCWAGEGVGGGGGGGGEHSEVHSDVNDLGMNKNQ